MRRFAVSWSVVAIVALALVTVVLALAALRSSGSGATGTPLPTASALPNSGGGNNKGKAEPAPDVEPLLSMVNPQIAFRGTVGTCSGGSTLQLTVDGGATWTKVKSPAPALTSLHAQTSVVATIVGGDQRCHAGAWNTTNAGGVWNGPNPTAGLWFRLPQTTRQIATPAGIVRSPCPQGMSTVREIIGLDDLNGYLLCPNGAIMASTDGGTSWQQKSVVADAAALAWPDPTQGELLRSNSVTCPAYLLLRSSDGGVTWSQGGCVGGAGDAAPQAPSPSLDYADAQNGLSIVKSGTYSTKDGGLTWHGPIR